jgi:hypothetical protein
MQEQEETVVSLQVNKFISRNLTIRGVFSHLVQTINEHQKTAMQEQRSKDSHNLLMASRQLESTYDDYFNEEGRSK